MLDRCTQYRSRYPMKKTYFLFFYLLFSFFYLDAVHLGSKSQQRICLFKLVLLMKSFESLWISFGWFCWIGSDYEKMSAANSAFCKRPNRVPIGFIWFLSKLLLLQNLTFLILAKTEKLKIFNVFKTTTEIFFFHSPVYLAVIHLLILLDIPFLIMHFHSKF